MFLEQGGSIYYFIKPKKKIKENTKNVIKCLQNNIKLKE